MILEHSIGVDTGRRYQGAFIAAWLLATAPSSQNLTQSAAVSIEVSAPAGAIANAAAQPLIGPVVRINISAPAGTISAGQTLIMSAAASVEVSAPAGTITGQRPFSPTPVAGQGVYPGTVAGHGEYK